MPVTGESSVCLYKEKVYNTAHIMKLTYFYKLLLLSLFVIFLKDVEYSILHVIACVALCSLTSKVKGGLACI